MNKKPENWIHGMSIEKKCIVLEARIEELEDKIKDLETELYFCNRNKQIKKEVDDQ